MGYTANDEYTLATNMTALLNKAVDSAYSSGIKDYAEQRSNISSEFDAYRNSADAQAYMQFNSPPQNAIGLDENMTAQTGLTTSIQSNKQALNAQQRDVLAKLKIELGSYMAQRDSGKQRGATMLFQQAGQNATVFKQGQDLAAQQQKYNRENMALQNQYNRANAARSGVRKVGGGGLSEKQQKEVKEYVARLKKYKATDGERAIAIAKKFGGDALFKDGNINDMCVYALYKAGLDGYFNNDAWLYSVINAAAGNSSTSEPSKVGIRYYELIGKGKITTAEAMQEIAKRYSPTSEWYNYQAAMVAAGLGSVMVQKTPPIESAASVTGNMARNTITGLSPAMGAISNMAALIGKLSGTNK